MDAERSRRFQRFIRQHVGAFAEMAQRGYASRGKGAVQVIVDSLEGGDEFRPQANLCLSYTPEADLQGDEILADVVSRCNFPEESVVAASYSDGTREITRVELHKMRQAAAGAAAQGQWTAERGMRP